VKNLRTTFAKSGLVGSLFVFLLIVWISCGDPSSSEDSGATDDDDDPVDDDDDSVDDDDDGGSPLFASAGKMVISPNESNHPETVYLSGVYPSRLSTGVHDDLMASAMMLAQGDEQVVLVSLDLHSFTRSRIREIQERLAALGFKKENILIASTHTHEAPDTLGVFGPSVIKSGVSRTYMTFIQDTIVDLVVDLRDRLTPVKMTTAIVKIDDPNSNYPTLTSDSRIPEITVDYLTAATFTSDQGETVATLVNWHSHPEVMIASTEVSSDFPQWVRERIEDRLGGSCVYISGALGGLASPNGVDVPARDENGDPVLDEGDPVYLSEATWEKTRSLGYVIADLTIEGLAGADAIASSNLSVIVEPLPLPVQNPIMIAAYYLGILEFDEQDRIRDMPELCGFFGCLDDRLALVRVGPLAILTSPGETFPETWIGREESTFDFGAPWGPFTFPAVEGIADVLDAGFPMHMSVCGNEIGYLIPEDDFHPRNHPDYYEEDLFLGYNTETLYRAAVTNLLEKN
jgi:Neutral/alkaline non-lysosomal ceramidase, N-terminal